MKLKSIVIVVFCLGLFILLNDTALAVDPPGGNAVPVNQQDTTTVSLTNPLTGTPNSKDIPTLLGGIIQYALGIIGSLALVMFIYGGATWMLSAGNQDRVSKGKQIIIWATVGIVIIFTSYALVKFLITTLAGAGGA